jgi:hypothetical protein
VVKVIIAILGSAEVVVDGDGVLLFVVEVREEGKTRLIGEKEEAYCEDGELERGVGRTSRKRSTSRW